MMKTIKPQPELSLPGEKAAGPSDPFQQSILFIKYFLSNEPTPDINTSFAKSSGLLVGNHLLQLIKACGLLNGSGFHSASVTLFRPLEDALDCFAAVTLVKDAAEKWGGRTLRPSDAAKLWTKIVDDDEEVMAEYRKKLRNQFAHYMHCSYDLCLWDLYFNPQAIDSKNNNPVGTYEINQNEQVINSNAHAIDAHLTAHLLEFITVIKQAYSDALKQKAEQLPLLLQLESEITKIMEQHNEHKCQNVLSPPEWQRCHS